MSPRRALALTAPVWLLSLALSIAALVAQEALEGETSGFETHLRWVSETLVVVAYSTVGLLIAARRSTVIGWLLIAIGLDHAVGFATATYERYAATTETLPLRTEAGGLSDFSWVAGILLLAFTAQLFPNGRLVGPRWRPLAWLTAAWPFILMLDLRLSPTGLHNGQPVPNPDGLEGVPGSIFAALVPVIVLLYPMILTGSVAAVVVRFRRAAGIEREQIKWMAYAVMAGMALFLVNIWVQNVSAVVGSVAILGIPIAIGLAVLRYRLYDIDLLINRTLVYGTLSAVLGVTYFLVVLAFGALLRPITAGSELAVALSTLAILALFQPLRTRIRSAVDRRFYRSRYDAARTLDEFSTRLRDEVDLEAVRADLLDAVAATIQPTTASLWIRG